MQCPICNSPAPYDDTYDNRVMGTALVEYRCDHGHIIQFHIPEFLLTVLVINDTGDELIRIDFNAKHQITKLNDWRFNPIRRYFEVVEIDLEGTGMDLTE